MTSSPRPPSRAGAAATWLRVLLVLLAVPVLTLSAAVPASAHATLEWSSPAQGSRLTDPPTEVTLGFGEEVALPRSLPVTDQNGHRVDDGAPRHPDGDGRLVRVALRPGTGHGSYTVSWRVVSVDGHPVAGTFAFGVGVPAGTVRQPAGVDPAVGTVRSLVQLFSYLGTALLLGGSCFLFRLWPQGRDSDRLRRLMVLAVLTAAVGALGSLLLQGPYVAGRGLTGIVDPGLLGETAGSSYGRPLLLRVLAVVLSVPVLGIWPRIPQDEDVGPGGVAGIGNAVLLAASFALTGHAAEASPAWPAELADALHLMAAGVWLGGLAVLALVIMPEAHRGAGRVVAAQVLPRWSTVAFGSVVVLVVTGGYQAWREVRDVGALPGTEYGTVLLSKLALVAALLVAAGVARHRVRSRVVTGTDPGGGLGLRRTVELETVLGLAVLVVTTFLVATPPARSTYAPPFSAVLTGRNAEGGRIRVTLEVAPTRAGRQTLRVRTSTTAGVAQPFEAVTGRLTPTGGAGPVRVAFTPAGPGAADAVGVVVPVAGRWTLTLQIRTDPTTDYAATVDYSVR